MNRREAIAALVSLPTATRITRAEIKPDDVIVIECPGYIAPETADRIKAAAADVWPSNKVVVLGDGMTLKVVSR